MKVLLSLTYGFQGHLSIDIQLAVEEQERKEHFLNGFYGLSLKMVYIILPTFIWPELIYMTIT